MTREEAIMVLKNEQPHCGKKALFPEEKKYEAFNVAIKALEAELATKTCNNKQVISKLVASEDCISRQAVLDMMQMRLSGKELYKAVYELPPVTPKQEPCEDTVSLGVFEQVMWERDTAIEQLKELGYGFGEKPKTGRWIEERTYMECPNCHDIWHYEENQTERFKCCPTCGGRIK